MKISKINSLDNYETGIDDFEDNEENIQLDINVPVVVEKQKRAAKKVKISEVEMTDLSSEPKTKKKHYLKNNKRIGKNVLLQEKQIV